MRLRLQAALIITNMAQLNVCPCYVPLNTHCTTSASLFCPLITFQLYQQVKISIFRCPAVRGAVVSRGVFSASWWPPRVHDETGATLSDVGWAPGKDPASTCKTGSPESGYHTQLPLLSHRSVLPLSLSLVLSLQSVHNELFSQEKRTAFIVKYIWSLQLNMTPWCGFRALLSAVCYSSSSGGHCLQLYEVKTHEILLVSRQFPSSVKLTCLSPIRLWILVDDGIMWKKCSFGGLLQYLLKTAHFPTLNLIIHSFTLQKRYLCAVFKTLSYLLQVTVEVLLYFL